MSQFSDTLPKQKNQIIHCNYILCWMTLVLTAFPVKPVDLGFSWTCVGYGSETLVHSLYPPFYRHKQLASITYWKAHLWPTLDWFIFLNEKLKCKFTLKALSVAPIKLCSSHLWFLPRSLPKSDSLFCLIQQRIPLGSMTKHLFLSRVPSADQYQCKDMDQVNNII